MTADLQLVTDPPPVPQPLDPPAPMFPELLALPGCEPIEFAVRKDSRSGPVVCKKDILADGPGDLPPGDYWLVACWPQNATRPSGSRGGFFSGGWREWKVAAPPAPVAPPPPPPPPVAAAMPPALENVLGRIATGLESVTGDLRQLSGRVALLERDPPRSNGSSGVAEKVMEVALQRLISPESPEVILERQMGLLERMATWRANGGPTAPETPPSTGELVVDAIEAAGEAFSKIPAAVRAAGDTMRPKEVLAKVRDMPESHLAAWLAEAVEAGIIPARLLESEEEAEQGLDLGAFAESALGWSGAAVSKTRKVVKLARALLGDKG